MGCAGGQQSSVRGFEHQAHAGGNGGQASDPFGAEQTRIGMREQAGLAQHEVAHGFEIMERRFVAEMAERFAHLGEKQFRLVAETEEGFGAA